MTTKLSRRTMLGGAAGAAATGVLAACGGEELAATATRVAPTVASAATAAAPVAATVASAATVVAPTVNSAASTAVIAATAVAPTVNSAAATVAAPAMMAAMPAAPRPDAYRGKTVTFFEGVQYYKAVQDTIRAEMTTFVKAGGGNIEVANQTDNGAQNVQKLQAAVDGGNAFDIGNGDGSIQQLLTLNLVADVTDVVTEMEAKYGKLMPLVPRNLSRDGKYFGVPFYVKSDVWFLRRDWLDEKGIKVENLKTFDNMRDAALEISDPGKRRYGWGQSPYPSGDGTTLIFQVIHNYGGALVSKEGTKVTFNSPETVAGVSWLSDLYQNPKYKNMLPPGWEGWNDSSNNETFLQGTLGITANAFTMYAKARDDKNPIFPSIATAPRPGGPAYPNGLRGGSPIYLYIPRGSKNVDVSKDIIRQMLTPTVWNKLAQQSGGLALPAYESQWANPFFKSDPNYLPLEAQVRDPLGYTQLHHPANQTAPVDAIGSQQILLGMMGDILQKGAKPADAVRDAHDRMVKVFEQFGVKQ